MRVRERDRERIGRIGLQLARNVEQYADHVLDLRLVRAAATDHGLLDFLGRVFGHRQTSVHHGADRRAARLAEFQCGIRIARHEYALHRHFGRPVLGDERADFVEDLLQAQRKGVVVEKIQRRVENVPRRTARIRIDDADAGTLRTGIDAEYAGHRADFSTARKPGRAQAARAKRAPRRKAMVCSAASCENSRPVCVAGTTQWSVNPGSSVSATLTVPSCGEARAPKAKPKPIGRRPAIAPTACLPSQRSRPRLSTSRLLPITSEPPGNCATVRATALPRKGEPRQTTRPRVISGARCSACNATSPPRLCPTKWIFLLLLFCAEATRRSTPTSGPRNTLA